MESLGICMGCMASLEEAASQCADCGWKPNTPAASPLHLAPGTFLSEGKIVIGRVLGHGGFGITYLGWDLRLEKKLAVKEYFPAGVAIRSGPNGTVAPFSGSHQQDFEYGLTRYLEEAQMLAKFQNHPNILSVLNFFKERGTAYIVMEFLEGVTFETYLNDHGGRISFNDALRLLDPIMEALDTLHESGVLHRDVSPDNIHISPDLRPKLLDFGAARKALGERSRNLSVILKEGYTPPEQYRTKGHQGPWTDVYAMAATFYRAITGTIPPAAMDRVQEDELRLPSDFSVEISEVEEQGLMMGLSVAIDHRIRSMNDLRSALRSELPQYVPGEPLTSPFIPDPPVTASAPPAEQKGFRLIHGVVLAGLVFFALVIVVSSRQTQSNPQLDDAEAKRKAAGELLAARPHKQKLDEAYQDLSDGQPEQATAALAAAINSNPECAECFELAGMIYSHHIENREDDAAKNYRRAVELGSELSFPVDRAVGTTDKVRGALKISKTTITYADGRDHKGAKEAWTAARSEVKLSRADSELIVRRDNKQWKLLCSKPAIAETIIRVASVSR